MSSATPTKWIAGAIAVAAIGASGIFIVRYFMKAPTVPDIEAGRVVAETFLADVRAGKAGQAWDASTAEFKSIEGKESFIRKTRSTPILSEPLQFNSSQSVMIQDEPRAEYLFQSPKAKMVRVLVGNERGNWKVDRLTL